MMNVLKKVLKNERGMSQTAEMVVLFVCVVAVIVVFFWPNITPVITGAITQLGTYVTATITEIAQ